MLLSNHFDWLENAPHVVHAGSRICALREGALYNKHFLNSSSRTRVCPISIVKTEGYKQGRTTQSLPIMVIITIIIRISLYAKWQRELH